MKKYYLSGLLLAALSLMALPGLAQANTWATLGALDQSALVCDLAVTDGTQDYDVSGEQVDGQLTVAAVTTVLGSVQSARMQGCGLVLNGASAAGQQGIEDVVDGWGTSQDDIDVWVPGGDDIDVWVPGGDDID